MKINNLIQKASVWSSQKLKEFKDAGKIKIKKFLDEISTDKRLATPMAELPFVAATGRFGPRGTLVQPVDELESLGDEDLLRANLILGLAAHATWHLGMVPLGLSALLSQDVRVRVLVLSNGTEGPERIPGADVLRVPWRGHGMTRQLAIPHIEDPYTLLTVNDAIPLGAGFVAQCLARAARRRGEVSRF